MHKNWLSSICAALALFAESHAIARGTPCPKSLAGHWEGEAAAGGKHFRLALDIDPASPRCIASVDYPDIPLYGAAFDITVDGNIFRIERHPKAGAASKLAVTVAGSAMSGSFDGVGVSAATVALRRTAKARTLREEAVSFANADVTLAGSLIIPSASPPYPAMVIAHGSGPQNRDWASYRSWGVLLARQGVAALIYDKRGTGGSTGDYSVASLDDLAKDVLAGVAVLKARSDIRADRIGIAGHSQGGWIAPLAATLSPDVAFILVTSASGIGPMAQSIFDNTNAMRAAGYSEADVAQAQDLRRRMYDGVPSGKFDAQLQADLAAASKAPWFAASQLSPSLADRISDGERRLLLFEPLPVWRKVGVPVLAIWGERDTEVPAEQSRDLIVSALHDGGNNTVETHMLPGLTHNLVQPKAPGATPDFARGTAQLEPIVSGWIARIVSPRNRG